MTTQQHLYFVGDGIGFASALAPKGVVRHGAAS
jgi:hypothetical protein